MYWTVSKGRRTIRSARDLAPQGLGPRDATVSPPSFTQRFPLSRLAPRLSAGVTRLRSRAASLRSRAASLPPRTLAFVALVATSVLWGSNAVVARTLLDGIAPTWLSFLRWIVVMVALTPFVWHERAAIARALRHDTRSLAIFAFLGFAPQTLLVYTGLAGTTAINMGLLNSAIPVLIVALVALARRRAPSPFESIGLAISVAGVLLIVAHGDLRALARLELSPSDLIVLLGMFVWALYTVRLVERDPQLSMAAFCFAAALMGLVFTLPMVAIELWRHGIPHPSWGTLAGVLYIGTLPTLVAMLLYGYAVARVGAVQAGIFTHLVPVFAAVFATLLIGEHLHAFHAGGFALIAGGAILCCLTPSPVLSSPRAQKRVATVSRA